LADRVAISGGEREGEAWPRPADAAAFLDRPSMAPWSGLWGGKAGGDAYRGTPVVVKMENPNWSISEISSPEDDDDDEDILAAAGGRRRKGARTKNAKQIRWVLLLKAHRAAGCLASLASAAVALGAAARRRVAAGRTDADADADAGVLAVAGESPVVRSGFYAFIRAFLVVSLLLLAVEVAAYINGWDLAASALALPALGLESLYASWLRFRAAYVAPGIQFLTDACVVLFLVQSADRLILCLGCFYIRVKRIKPEPKSPALPDAEDPDAGYYPMVLVQIPMCNEKEVGAVVFLALNKQF
jgi:putative intracellular protease/amidase